MKEILYQLKSILKDKFCLMTFLLPILVAAALHFMGSIDLSTLGELHFGFLTKDLSEQTVAWLARYGSVTAYDSAQELVDAIREPSTNLIGVRADGDTIRCLIAGDELDVFQRAAATLPTLYEQRESAARVKVRTLIKSDTMALWQDFFIAAVLIVAMFMGCTFNAVNIISEKEDGVAFVNEILPLTPGRYIAQKIAVGFLCGCLSSVLTACICFRLSPANTGVMLALIVPSAFVAALTGLWIGRLSEGLMTGIVYLKIFMLLFIAIPILCLLTNAKGLPALLSYLVPSQPAFEGIMNLAAGNTAAAVKDVGILLVHCIAWTGLYGLSAKRAKTHA